MALNIASPQSVVTFADPSWFSADPWAFGCHKVASKIKTVLDTIACLYTLTFVWLAAPVACRHQCNLSQHWANVIINFFTPALRMAV